jgi:hypothetical protein
MHRIETVVIRSFARAFLIACVACIVACERPTQPTANTPAAPPTSEPGVTRVTASADGDSCAYAFGPQTPPSAAGGAFTVDVTSSCPWTASSDQPWLTTSSRSSAWSSHAPLSYAVAPNSSGSPRTGRITVSGGGSSAQLIVTQPSSTPCVSSIVPSAVNVAGAGASGQSAVTVAGTNCGWAAQANQPWITITSGFSGTTSGTIAYTVAANAGAAQRFGRIIVSDTGGTTDISFTQAAGAATTTPCTPIIPQAVSFPATGGSAQLSVTFTTPNCLWDVRADQPWISITSASVVTGTIAYAVAANGGGARSGHLVISYSGGGTAEITISQAPQGVIAGFSVSPNPCEIMTSPSTAASAVILACTFDASGSSSATGIYTYNYSLSPNGPPFMSTFSPTVTNPQVGFGFPSGAVNIYLTIVPNSGPPVTSAPVTVTFIDLSGC